MSKQEPLPAPDQEFDTLQAIIVTAVTTNASAWSIPTAEITKVNAAGVSPFSAPVSIVC